MLSCFTCVMVLVMCSSAFVGVSNIGFILGLISNHRLLVCSCAASRWVNGVYMWVPSVLFNFRCAINRQLIGD